MVHPESASKEEQNRQSLIEQFAFFSDEIAAQAPILGRIPESILAAEPFDGAVSILARYRSLLEREHKIHVRLSELAGEGPTGERRDGEEGDGPLNLDGVESDTNMATLLDGLSRLRSVNAEFVRKLNIEMWSFEMAKEEADQGNDRAVLPFSAWIYQATLVDAEKLKEIAEHLFEQQLKFNDPD